MRGWLLDTSVVSELCKAECNPRVRQWAEDQSPTSLFLSTVTVAEIRYGIERLPIAGPQRTRLDSWLTAELRPWFADRLLGVDEEVLLTWRRLVEQGRATGHSFSQPDLFIAATALLHDLCVVTRNVADFVHAGVPVLNPWTEPGPASAG